jgi:hypothetical protein
MDGWTDGVLFCISLPVDSRLFLARPPQNNSQQYDKYMAANDVSKGGSFYLQSKVYRAKELLDEYVEEKKMEDRSTGEAAAKPPNDEETRA